MGFPMCVPARAPATSTGSMQQRVSAKQVDRARKILTLSPMITSRLTSKAQTTIPQAVRTALGLLPGDAIAYQIEDGRAVLTRFNLNPETDDPLGTFSEWGSTADEKAYGKL
jgi:antitoxin PrlF